MKSATFSVNTTVRPVGFPPVAKTLPGAIERIVSELKPEKIILFGSYAYGNPSPDSDVDLLVVMPFEGKNFKASFEIMKRIHPGFPIDILARRPDDTERRYREGDPLIREALD